MTLPLAAALTIETVLISDINLPDNWCDMSMDQVNKYRDFLLDGYTLAPVLLFHDGDRYWLIDGRHRFVAAVTVGHNQVRAFVTDSLRMVA